MTPTLLFITLLVFAAATTVSARWDWHGNPITRAALRRDPSDPTNLRRYELPTDQPGDDDIKNEPSNITRYTGNNTDISDCPDNQDFGPLVALVTIKRQYNKKGWDWVELTAAQDTLSVNKSLSYYGVGYLEGYYTFDTIADAWYNWGTVLEESFKGDEFVTNWINDHIKYLRGFEKSNETTHPASAQVFKLMRWLDGLVDGYNAARSDMEKAGVAEAKEAKPLTFFQLFLMNFQDEIGDVQQAEPNSKLNPGACPPATTTTTAAAATTTTTAAGTTTSTTTAGTTTSTTTGLLFEGDAAAAAEQDAVIKQQAEERMRTNFNEHCSSLVKLTSNDVLITHTTWAHYRTMGRQYKTYHLEHTLVLSGYPTNFASSDDWVLTSHRLVVTETTNNQFSNELSRLYVTPQTVSEWIRVAVANLLAPSAKAWGPLYLNGDGNDWTGWNSGTYCNQQIVLDLNRIDEDDIVKNKALKSDTLWILEQLPGPYSASADMSSLVTQKTYWPSFNRNYFQSTADASCVTYYAQQNGPVWGYKDYCRYIIFARMQDSVKDVDSMKTVIRYNDYKNDPASHLPWVNVSVQIASLTIAARYDLIPNPMDYGNASQAIRSYLVQKYDGAIDAKITSWRLMTQTTPIPAGASFSTPNSVADYGDGNGVFNSSNPLIVKSHIINGPTTSNGIAPFKWPAGDIPNNGHHGQPDEFNFGWVESYDSLSPPAMPKRGVRKATPTWTVVIVAACVVGSIVIFVVVYKTFFARDPPPSVVEVLNESAAADRRAAAASSAAGGANYSPKEQTEGQSEPLIK